MPKMREFSRNPNAHASCGNESATSAEIPSVSWPIDFFGRFRSAHPIRDELREGPMRGFGGFRPELAESVANDV